MVIVLASCLLSSTMIGLSHSRFRSPVLTLATLSANGNLGLLLNSALTSSTGVSTALTLAIALTAFNVLHFDTGSAIYTGKVLVSHFSTLSLSLSRC